MILVFDRLTSKIDKVQNSFSLFRRLCKLGHVREKKNIFNIENKPNESLTISSKYVLSLSLYKPNNVGERGHPWLALMLDITSPCVTLVIHIFA